MNVRSHKSFEPSGWRTSVLGAIFGLALAPLAQAALIGQWTFNEGSLTTAYDTAGSNNGTLSNGASYVANGAGNYAVRFGDGSGAGAGNDVVNYPNTATFNMGPNFSIEAWVKLDTNNGGVDWFFGKDHSTFARYGLLVAGGQYRFDVGSYNTGGPNYFETASTPLSVGVWDHLVGTFDGATIKLYKNGTLADSTPWPEIYGPYSPTGQIPTAGPFYYNQGSIDQAQLWNETLSDSQVLALYQSGPIGVPEPASTAAVATLAVVALGSRKRRQ